ncbi:histidine kinase [Flavobacterium sp. FZUC8N2.13]|uniref:Histidine kinase n=1 Tax=Flavobacterium zubiriense TaxID=3138075 RepID=A0ABV4T7L7_9FLAO
MKKDVLKIVLLVLILVVTDLIMIFPISEKPKDPNWEYVKNRLFDGETSLFRRTEGPILFDLHEVSKSDSLLVKEVMLDLRKLLPNKKIEFFDDFTGMTFLQMVQEGKDKPSYRIKGLTIEEIDDSRILLHFEPSYLYKNRGNQFINIGAGYSIQMYPFERIGNKIKRSFPLTTVAIGDVYTPEQKKNYLMIGMLRNLVFIQNEPSTIEQSSVFSSKEIQGLDCRILDKDIFLLQKLYSDDFFEQFKTYLNNTYTWQYATSFLNKKLATLYAILIVGSIGILEFILLFGLFQNKKFKFSFLNYFFPILLIMLFGTDLTKIYTYLTDLGINENMNLESILELYSIAFIGSLIISFPLWLLEKIWINKIKDFSFLLICKVIFTFITFNIPIGIMYIKYPPSTSNDGFLEFYLPIFILTIIIAMSRGLLLYLNHYSDSLVKEKDVELSRLKEVNAQSELKLLQSHINPHFLYNALNSIAGLAHNNPDKTEKMALSLSNLFRYSINKKGQKLSTVKEEVLMVENYLEIEKIRFGKRLNFTLLIDETIENEPIPMYILQPLVENAIKHGISEIRGEGFITLEIKKEVETLFIIVSDNGPDFPSSLVSGHGLQTVYDLLRLSYGEKAALKWENNPKKHIAISITQTI